jgi:hypothetical protein
VNRLAAEEYDICQILATLPTKTQWVRNVADSHPNRSILQRLSFMSFRACGPRNLMKIASR